MSGHLDSAKHHGSVSPVHIGVILLAAALPRVWAAIFDQGIFWPDEIFQSLEQAHRFAFGYGFVSWEFQDGARSWLFPGALGLFWKLLAWLGVRGAPALVVSAKLVMVTVALVGIYASMRVGEKLAGAEGAVLSGVLAALFPPSIVYGSRCMTEMASGPVIVVAVLLALDSKRWKLVLAGCMAALAIFLRYQNGLITVGLLGWLVAERRRSDALAYAVGAAVTVLAGGVLDLFTWGAPFHSFSTYVLTYVRDNLAQGKSGNFGVEPLDYFVAVAWSAAGVSVLAVAIGLCACAKRATGLLVVVLLYVLAHSLVPHKEYRFIMPIVPLMLALGGAGLALLIARFLPMRPAVARAASKRASRARSQRHERNAHRQERTQTQPAPSGVRTTIWVVAGVLAAAMGWQTTHASFEDFGQRRRPLSGSAPLWHRREAVNRLLWAAGKQPDLCGLALIDYGPIWTGGYTYLHRDVPILWDVSIGAVAKPGLGAIGASTNYVLTRAEVKLPEEYSTILTIDEAKLARRAGSCAAPPDSFTRLFPK